MANNLTIKDGAGASQVLATTEAAGVHTPKHEVTASALPTGAATAANQTTIIGHVDGIESTLATLATSANQTSQKASIDLTLPAGGGQAVTPSDSTTLSGVRALYIGGGGTMVATVGGADLTFVGLVAGTVLPVRATKVKLTGTTATNIVALT